MSTTTPTTPGALPSSPMAASTPASTQILFNAPALHALKREQLVGLCKIHGLKTGGRSAELVRRLQAYAKEALVISPKNHDNDEVKMEEEGKQSAHRDSGGDDDDGRQWGVLMATAEDAVRGGGNARAAPGGPAAPIELRSSSSFRTLLSSSSLRFKRSQRQTRGLTTSSTSATKAATIGAAPKRTDSNEHQTIQKSQTPFSPITATVTTTSQDAQNPDSTRPTRHEIDIEIDEIEDRLEPDVPDNNDSEPTYSRSPTPIALPVPGDRLRLGRPAPPNARLALTYSPSQALTPLGGNTPTTTVRLVQPRPVSAFNSRSPSPPRLPVYETRLALEFPTSASPSPGPRLDDKLDTDSKEKKEKMNFWFSPSKEKEPEEERLYPSLPTDQEPLPMGMEGVPGGMSPMPSPTRRSARILAKSTASPAPVTPKPSRRTSKGGARKSARKTRGEEKTLFKVDETVFEEQGEVEKEKEKEEKKEAGYRPFLLVSPSPAPAAAKTSNPFRPPSPSPVPPPVTSRFGFGWALDKNAEESKSLNTGPGGSSYRPFRLDSFSFTSVEKDQEDEEDREKDQGPVGGEENKGKEEDLDSADNGSPTPKRTRIRPAERGPHEEATPKSLTKEKAAKSPAAGPERPTVFNLDSPVPSRTNAFLSPRLAVATATPKFKPARPTPSAPSPAIVDGAAASTSKSATPAPAPAPTSAALQSKSPTSTPGQPLIFGSKDNSPSVTDAQFTKAASSILEEMNRRLGLIGPTSLNVDLVRGRAAGQSEEWLKAEEERERREAEERAERHEQERREVKERFEKKHEKAFEKMGSIKDHYAARRAEKEKDDYKVGEKRKSTVLSEEEGGGKEEEKVGAAGTSKGKVQAARPGPSNKRALTSCVPASSSSKQQDEERKAKRARIEEKNKEEKVKQDRVKKAKEERERREREAVRKRLEEKKRVRRFSAGKANGSFKPKPVASTSNSNGQRFGFLSSAKNAVKNVLRKDGKEGDGESSRTSNSSNAGVLTDAKPVTRSTTAAAGTTVKRASATGSGASHVNKPQPKTGMEKKATGNATAKPIVGTARTVGTMSKKPVPASSTTGRALNPSTTTTTTGTSSRKTTAPSFAAPTQAAAAHTRAASGSSTASSSGPSRTKTAAPVRATGTRIPSKTYGGAGASVGVTELGVRTQDRPKTGTGSRLFAPTAASLAKANANTRSTTETAKRQGLFNAGAKTNVVGQNKATTAGVEKGKIFTNPITTAANAPASPTKLKSTLTRKPALYRPKGPKTQSQAQTQNRIMGPGSGPGTPSSARVRSNMSVPLSGKKSAVEEAAASARKAARMGELSARKELKRLGGGENEPAPMIIDED